MVIAFQILSDRSQLKTIFLMQFAPPKKKQIAIKNDIYDPKLMNFIANLTTLIIIKTNYNLKELLEICLEMI